MVRVRPTAELCADFPDDQIDDGHDIVQFGGRGVTAAIGEILTALGYEVSEPIEMEFLGWELDAKRRGHRYWVRLSDHGDGKYAVYTAAVTLAFWVQRIRHAQFLKDLHAGLRQDPRFGSIKWFADYNNPREVPSDTPVDD